MIRLFYLICLALYLPIAANAQTYSVDGIRSNVVIDVRTPEEFASEHINGAINIPYDQIEARRSALDKVKKDENILVYCRSGRRSEIARQSLQKLGFKNVQNGGGIDGLMAKIKTCKAATSC